MPTKDAHKETIDRNKKFQVEIKEGNLSEDYNEWQIVSLFYAAVHTIDLTLHFSGYSDAGNHTDRFKMLEQETKAVGGYNFDLLNYYTDLYTYSEWARYKCKKFSDKEVSQAKQTFIMLEKLAYYERKKKSEQVH